MYLVTFVFLRFGNADRNVLVLLTVMEANLDQVLLDGEAVERGVLHGPRLLPPPRIDDGIDLLVGGLSWNQWHKRVEKA